MSQFPKPRSARSIKATLSTILCTGLVLASVVVLNVGNTAAYAEDGTDTTTSAVDQTADSQAGPTEQATDPAPEAPTPSAEAPAPSTPAPTTSKKVSTTSEGSYPGGGSGGGDCVGTPFWSFTYDKATSTGTITVNGGDAGQTVCKPLYVRAASWKYTVTTGTTTPTWPQNLIGYNDYTINKIGTYTFTAPGIVCGQDDIYATFDYAGLKALDLPLVLLGAHNPFEPQFLHQALPDTGTPEGVTTWTVDPLTDCVAPGIAGISVEKTASTQTVAPGQVFNYTLAVNNSGTSAATGVVLTDDLDANLKVSGAITAAGWTVTPTDPAELNAYGAKLTFTRTADGGSVNAGATLNITIPVIVNPAADSAITTIPNTAVVCATNVADCDDDLITLPLYDPKIAVVKTVAFASDNPNSQTDDADGTGTLVGEGKSKFVYTITASNPGLGAATGVTVVDTLPADLRVAGTIIAPDWTWTTSGGDADGFGTTVHFTLKAASLAAGATAGAIQIPVEIRETTVASQQDNTATACVTNLPVNANCASDDVLVKVKSIELTTFTSKCESDVPWLYYDLTVNNIDLSTHPVHFTWYGPNNVAVDTYTLTNGVWTNSAGDVVPYVPDGSPYKGKILWPGAAIDANGIGIAFPGWRPAVEGETPTFENLILDPTLPTWQLRQPGSYITVQINPTVTAMVLFPEATEACAVVRDSGLVLTKTAVADGTNVEITKTFPDSVFDFLIQVANVNLGAAANVHITDPIPSDIKVDQVITAGSPAFPRWAPCTVTGTDASGFGGVLDCTLVGMVAPNSSAPDIRLKVSVASDPAQIITNVATVKWTETDPGTIFSTSDDARVTTDGSELPTLCVDCGALADDGVLAGTGVDPALPITLSLLAVLAGVGLIVAASPKRRRRDR